MSASTAALEWRRRRLHCSKGVSPRIPTQLAALTGGLGGGGGAPAKGGGDEGGGGGGGE